MSFMCETEETIVVPCADFVILWFSIFSRTAVTPLATTEQNSQTYNGRWCGEICSGRWRQFLGVRLFWTHNGSMSWKKVLTISIACTLQHSH